MGEEEYWVVTDEFLCTSRTRADAQSVKIDEVKTLAHGRASPGLDRYHNGEREQEQEGKRTRREGIIWWRRIRPRQNKTQ
jgi:hypothetical protein